MVRVQPNASQNGLLGFKDGVLHVRVAAPPLKGKANRELIRFLSDILGIRKASLTIEKGAANRWKVIGISGLTQREVAGLVERLDMQNEFLSDKHSRSPGYDTIC